MHCAARTLSTVIVLEVFEKNYVVYFVQHSEHRLTFPNNKGSQTKGGTQSERLHQMQWNVSKPKHSRGCVRKEVCVSVQKPWSDSVPPDMESDAESGSR